MFPSTPRSLALLLAGRVVHVGEGSWGGEAFALQRSVDCLSLRYLGRSYSVILVHQVRHQRASDIERLLPVTYCMREHKQNATDRSHRCGPRQG